MSDTLETPDGEKKFDESAYPANTLFHERREGRDRRRPDGGADRTVAERREKKERRRRIDPTTFEKQYTDDELEFMTAMQRFKVLTGKAFPSHGEVLKVAVSLGYRKVVIDDDEAEGEMGFGDAAEPTAGIV